MGGAAGKVPSLKTSVSREVPDQLSTLSKPLVGLWGSFRASQVKIIELRYNWAIVWMPGMVFVGAMFLVRLEGKAYRSSAICANALVGCLQDELEVVDAHIG